MTAFLLILTLLLALLLYAERGRLLRRSTWSFFKQSNSIGEAAHGYVYGRWTRRYVHMLLYPPFPPSRKSVTGLAERYHGKVLTPDHARAIVSNERRIPLRDLEQIIPFRAARRLVLDGPPDIAAYECACRHNRPAHCQPTQVCMVIGQPMVDFVLNHHPKSSRRLTQQEALDLLEAERLRGHVHSAWFKDAMLGRFYAICNCCKCCCGGIRTMMDSAVPMLAASGFAAEVDRDLCGACATCVEACPFEALAMGEAGVERNWDRCMGCGVCESLCPNGAARLVRDEGKGIPLDVRALPA
jgi:NAD-dependent dihydropyrimidine dehydrogenase PreA subunit